MSHFTVTVCLDDSSGHLARAIAIAQQDASPGGFLYQVIGQRVGTALAPFDENTEVTPRRRITSPAHRAGRGGTGPPAGTGAQYLVPAGGGNRHGDGARRGLGTGRAAGCHLA